MHNACMNNRSNPLQGLREGMSQREVGKLLGVYQSVISRWERHGLPGLVVVGMKLSSIKKSKRRAKPATEESANV